MSLRGKLPGVGDRVIVGNGAISTHVFIAAGAADFARFAGGAGAFTFELKDLGGIAAAPA